MSEPPAPPGPDLRPLAPVPAHAAAPSGLDPNWSTSPAPLPDLPGFPPGLAADIQTQAQLTTLSSAGGVGAGFLVDPDKAQVAIKTLEEATGHLLDALRIGIHDGWFRPPGEDHVSLRIADNANLMVRNAFGYVRVLADQVETVRNALQAQLDAYQAADHLDTARRA